MSELREELRTKWNQALSASPGGQEWRGVALSLISPVRLLAGIRDRDNHIGILFEAAIQYAPRYRIRFHAEGISLSDQRIASEGILRLAVTLEREDLRDVFEIVATDLLTVTAASETPEQSIGQLIRRLEAWQACLRVRQRGLSREEQAGLIGELAVASLAAESIGLPQALDAWKGPLDDIHDFHNAGVAVEVKTTIGVSQNIRVSHLDQLNGRGLDTLLLARVRLQESPTGKTLPEYIAAIRDALSEPSPGSATALEEKLMRAGYLDTDAELYGSLRTMLLEICAFRVDEGFPRITRETAPMAVVDAAYSLDERQLAPFRIGMDEFKTALIQMGATV
jgi:hypothetical protein